MGRTEKSPSARAAQAVQQLCASDDVLAGLADLRRLADQTAEAEQELVDRARAAGISWSAIGAVYGLTKQGAQQRFKRKPAADVPG